MHWLILIHTGKDLAVEPVSAGNSLFIFPPNFKKKKNYSVSNTCLSKNSLAVYLGPTTVHYERELYPGLVYAELGNLKRKLNNPPTTKAHMSLCLTKHFTVDGTYHKLS